MTVVENDVSPALAVELGPWLERVSVSAVHWARLPSHDGRLGVVVELRADVTDATLSVGNDLRAYMVDATLSADHALAHLERLREAVELVLLTLAVEPSALRPLLVREPQSPDEDDAIESVVDHRARTELRLRLDFRSIKTYVLGAVLAPQFLGEFDDVGLSTNPAFRRLRSGLLARLQGDEAARLSQLAVPVTIEVDSRPVTPFTLSDADDFFVHLTEFSQKATQIRDMAASSSWQVDPQPVPLVVQAVDLTLRRFCITHGAVRAAKTFMAAGTPVCVKRLNIDPRFISCARDDVLGFVATLSEGAKGLRIDTGVDPDEERTYPIDELSQDRRTTIQVILDAVTKAEAIRELNLGGLLRLCVAEHNRRHVWQCIFRLFSSRDVIAETVTFEHDVVFESEDEELIQEAAAHWRQRTPCRKLFIKTLKLRLVAESEPAEAFLRAIDDVETIELSNRGGDFSPPILTRLLSYPSLKRLKLQRQIVPTMDIFDPSIEDPDLPIKPVLEELALDDSALLDVSSMLRFLEKLRCDVEEINVLATTLQRFSVAQSSKEWEQSYLWDRTALEALDRVLTTSRTLREVRVLAVSGDECYRACDVVRLVVHNQCLLPAGPSMRRTELVKARNLALLSAVRSRGDTVRNLLDVPTVRHILEFAAPHQTRTLELQLLNL